jgi:hypothetical protein
VASDDLEGQVDGASAQLVVVDVGEDGGAAAEAVEIGR